MNMTYIFVGMAILTIILMIILTMVSGRENWTSKQKRAKVCNRTQDLVDSSMEKTINEERAIINLGIIEKHDFDIGETRFFTNHIDIPKNFQQPKNMFFLGQLNCKMLSKYDTTNMLPKDGQIYFFCTDFLMEKDGCIPCSVYYCKPQELTRQDAKPFDFNELPTPSFSAGTKDVTADVEKYNSQFYWNSEGNTIEFDSFYHSSISKIFGYYTHCQKSMREVLDISSKYVVLLQLGDNILADGSISFLIKENDLKNKDFSKVILTYSLS